MSRTIVVHQPRGCPLRHHYLPELGADMGLWLARCEYPRPGA